MAGPTTPLTVVYSGGGPSTPPSKVLRNAIRSAVARPLRMALRAACRIAPKDGPIVMASTPDYGDSVRAVVPAIVERGERVTLLATSDEPVPSWLPEEVEVISLRSPDALRRFLRAPVVYFTHGLFGSTRPVRGQIVANLWHGMPIKRIDPGVGVRGPECSFTVATAGVFAPSLAACFHLPEAAVEVTGLPRNDLLTDEALPDPDVVRSETGASRYVVMLPTYRRSHMGPGRYDSSDESLVLPAAERARLDGVLERHDLALLVKPHPVSPAGVLDSWLGPRTHLIDDRWLAQRDLTLYGVLSGASTLITDYSSSAIDFLVTGRPILLFQPDLEAYGADRGFALPDRILETIGERAQSPAELVVLLDDLAGSGFPRRYSPAAELVGAPAGGATERMLAAVERRRADAAR